MAKKIEVLEKKPANSWMKQLKSYDDAVDFDYDPFAPENCMYTPSPYFNFIFANKAHGIPKNASVLLYSEAKSGKSLTAYSLIGSMHKNDPEGIAVYFNTELRGSFSPSFAGMDKNRVVIYDSNSATDIFDRCEHDLKKMVDEGMPLRMIIIDSLTNIQGIKREAAESVANHLMGDRALTLQIGLSKLIPFCKRNKILLIATEQMRANIQTSGGGHAPALKAASTMNTLHSFEYYVSLKRAGAAEDKLDIEGKTYEDEMFKDARGNKLLNGHKVYAKCEANSIGQAGRSGIFTLDYDKGIVNQHEEIFWLAKGMGILATTNNRTYTYKDLSFNGKKECALAIQDNPDLAASILADVKALDAK